MWARAVGVAGSWPSRNRSQPPQLRQRQALVESGVDGGVAGVDARVQRACAGVVDVEAGGSVVVLRALRRTWRGSRSGYALVPAMRTACRAGEPEVTGGLSDCGGRTTFRASWHTSFDLPAATMMFMMFGTPPIQNVLSRQ
jgi:hypothetical protein